MKSDEVRLTFSQREGKVPLPDAMRLGHLSKSFRNVLWLFVDAAIKDSYPHNDYYQDDGVYKNSEFGKLIQLYIFRVKNEPHDQLDHTMYNHSTLLKKTILHGGYHCVMTFVEFILRQTISTHNVVMIDFRKNLETLFHRDDVAYTVQIIHKLPTIVPRSSPESTIATECAIETVEQEGSDGAKTHLRIAVERLNSQDYADSIKHSISAVESIARTIDPRASKDLGPALDSLQTANVLKHKAFKDALNKLYGYTSDEKGIRHSLLEKGVANVGLDEAVFMFAACAAFGAYLINSAKVLGVK